MDPVGYINAPFEYKGKHSYDVRRAESKRVLDLHPLHVPVIVETNKLTRNKITGLTKNKYLVSNDLTLGQFIHILRKNISQLLAEESIFLFINNTLAPPSKSMSQIYHDEKDDDGFMYCMISKMETFGL